MSMAFYSERMEVRPPCEKCGEVRSMMHHTRRGVYCSTCVGKIRKPRKQKTKFLPSKPLRPGRSGVYAFHLDQMICREGQRWFHLEGYKTAKIRVGVRQHRVRQRRANEFLIQEALAAMDQEGESTEILYASG